MKYADFSLSMTNIILKCQSYKIVLFWHYGITAICLVYIIEPDSVTTGLISIEYLWQYQIKENMSLMKKYLLHKFFSL